MQEFAFSSGPELQTVGFRLDDREVSRLNIRRPLDAAPP